MIRALWRRRRMATATAEEESALPRRSFPDEIESEILLWLPVKTLKRFKCACKSWYSLISSPQFQNDHFRRAQTRPPLLLTLHNDQRETDRDYYLTLRFSAFDNEGEGSLTLVNSFSITLQDPCYEPYMISSLGLVCLFQKYGSHPILVCNPSTHELITLPPTKRSAVSIGFGFTASTHQFKVVAVSYRKEEYQCEVFTLGTRFWRKAKNPPCDVDKGIAPFLHKAVHFLPHVSFNGVKDTDRISVFDIDTEEFIRTISLPDFYYSLGDCQGHGILITKEFLRLSILGGSLCLTFDFGELRCRLDLWLLKDYKNAAWVKAYAVDVSPVYPYPSYGFWTYPTDNMVDESILLNCSTQEGVKSLHYDPKDEVVTLKDKEWAAAFYTESIYSLKIT